jgi:hypothetical protein
MKHLVHWVSALGPKEINMHCCQLPSNHNAQHFHKGITGLLRLTSQEHKGIYCILLGVIVNLPLSGSQFSTSLAYAVCAMLDFIYLSQYSVHTTESLEALDSALHIYHEEKDVFIKLGVQKHFNILKLHSLAHYQRLITLFSASDNYNTEKSKWLHINFTKKAFQVTNFKDILQQMVIWIEHLKAMQQHTAFMQLHKGSSIVPIPL